jgi:hypothetical protein
MIEISDCFDRGFQFEDRAMNIFRENGHSVEKATQDEDMKQHIDFWAVGKDGVRYSFDAKAMRSLVRGGPLQDTWVVVEWKNVLGNPGSIYGAQDFFVFERMSSILLVRRDYLLTFAQQRVDFKKVVHRSDYALYGVYSRKGRNDLISQINLDDLPPNAIRSFQITK